MTQDNENKTIYVVTDGDYSDYHICGIFSDPEKAEEAKNLYSGNRDEARIEEYTLDFIPCYPQGLLYWCVEMDRDGNSTCNRRSVGNYNIESECPDGFDWQPCGDEKHVMFHMWAKDEMHAVKIANEHRTQLIATNKWNTDWESWHKTKYNKRSKS